MNDGNFRLFKRLVLIRKGFDGSVLHRCDLDEVSPYAFFGKQCLRFWTRCDVRLGTAPAQVQWTPQSQVSATQLTSSQVATQEADKGFVDCQLEITHAKPLLMAAFREVNRPCVEKILRLQDICMKFNALS